MRLAVVKSFRKKLTPRAAGLISSFCPKLAGTKRDKATITAKNFFINR
jgi:hypothetical protein